MGFVPVWDKCLFMKPQVRRSPPYKGTVIRCVTVQEDSSEDLNTQPWFVHTVLRLVPFPGAIF